MESQYILYKHISQEINVQTLLFSIMEVLLKSKLQVFASGEWKYVDGVVSWEYIAVDYKFFSF